MKKLSILFVISLVFMFTLSAINVRAANKSTPIKNIKITSIQWLLCDNTTPGGYQETDYYCIYSTGLKSSSLMITTEPQSSIVTLWNIDPIAMSYVNAIGTEMPYQSYYIYNDGIYFRLNKALWDSFGYSNIINAFMDMADLNNYQLYYNYNVVVDNTQYYQGYNDGYTSGKYEGMNIASQNSYDNGYNTGYSKGYGIGKTDGIGETQPDVFQAGYDKGVSQIFFADFDKWIVPAIITVMAIGSFVAVIKMRNGV